MLCATIMYDRISVSCTLKRIEDRILSEIRALSMISHFGSVRTGYPPQTFTMSCILRHLPAARLSATPLSFLARATVKAGVRPQRHSVQRVNLFTQAPRHNLWTPCTSRHYTTSTAAPPPAARTEAEAEEPIYNGALSRTFRNLKLFSLSSLGLASALTPFMFLIESTLPFSGRVFLATTAMATSGISTGLVAWCGSPYVTSIRRVKIDDGDDAGTALQFETLTLFLRRKRTTVYDTSFLTEAKRPFAKYELAIDVVMKDAGRAGPPGAEETIAETMDEKGAVLGRWIVRWNKDGTRGTCHGHGRVARYFNVDDGFLSL